tara:strand:- start:166 stop:576 length:411 start_codon:yes stop_codon:yes gene_type:complete
MPAPKYEPLGVTCKEAAWHKANEFKRDYEAEKAGLLPPRSIRDAEAKTIQSHAEDYLSDLKARGRDGRKGKGAKQIRSRLERLIRECVVKPERDYLRFFYKVESWSAIHVLSNEKSLFGRSQNLCRMDDPSGPNDN